MNGLDALVDDMRVSDIVFSEEGLQASLTHALGVLERRPAGEEIAEHQSVLVLEPVERLGEVLLEGVGDAVGEPAHVPYKNEPQVLTDLIGDQNHAAVEYASMAAPHIQAGKLRGLAVVGSHRKPALPDIPTAVEAGLPGFEITAWYGDLVPAGTPPEMVARLHKELTAALKSKEYVEFVESFGSTVVESTPEEFAAAIKLERTRLAKIIAQAGIRLD